MNIDERLEALTMNLELASRDIQDLRASVQELIAAQQEGYTKTLRNFELVIDSIKMQNFAGSHDQRLVALAKQCRAHDIRSPTGSEVSQTPEELSPGSAAVGIG